MNRDRCNSSFYLRIQGVSLVHFLVVQTDSESIQKEVDGADGWPMFFSHPARTELQTHRNYNCCWVLQLRTERQGRRKRVSEDESLVNTQIKRMKVKKNGRSDWQAKDICAFRCMPQMLRIGYITLHLVLPKCFINFYYRKYYSIHCLFVKLMPPQPA